jgi:hypothetical protein
MRSNATMTEDSNDLRFGHAGLKLGKPLVHLAAQAQE